MLFPTLEFALFFFFVLGVSWAIYQHGKSHRFFLLIASYFFYACWNWHYCLLLFVLSAFAWLGARLILNAATSQQKKITLTLSISFFVIVLVYYKYTGFLLTNFSNLIKTLFGGSNSEGDLLLTSPLLPLGISFITFHAISLLFDAYRQKLAQTPSLMNVLLYVSFFPQLIAGPILRASHFLPQLERDRQGDHIRITRAGFLIVLGLFKKVILANYLGTELVDGVFDGSENTKQTLLGVYGYSIQIFCDFSGYTDIAIGCALLLGYRFPLNFRNPYIATSIQDFWRRWHITLSTWLRDYLYIPMGGSKGGLYRTLFCLMMTMVIGGLWHGAGWQFVIWGAYHGLLLVLHRLWSQYAQTKDWVWRKSKWWKVLSIILVFHWVTLGWIWFRAANMQDALVVIQNLGLEIVQNRVFQDLDLWALLAIVLGLALQIIPNQWRAKIERTVGRLPWFIQGLLMAVCIALIEYFGPIGVAPFIYFQF
jgi:D-alanyl-lipoteichoic acid acyltransferase DltB (MBOAT superfamily)